MSRMKPTHLLAPMIAALLLVPAVAHADSPDDIVTGQYTDGAEFGINCVYELLWSDNEDGSRLYTPALPYEVSSLCGHDPVIAWGDEPQAIGPNSLEFWIDYLAAPVEIAPEVVPESTTEQVIEEPAALAVPSAPVVVPVIEAKPATVIFEPVPTKGYRRP